MIPRVVLITKERRTHFSLLNGLDLVLKVPSAYAE